MNYALGPWQYSCCISGFVCICGHDANGNLISLLLSGDIWHLDTCVTYDTTCVQQFEWFQTNKTKNLYIMYNCFSTRKAYTLYILYVLVHVILINISQIKINGVETMYNKIIKLPLTLQYIGFSWNHLPLHDMVLVCQWYNLK